MTLFVEGESKMKKLKLCLGLAAAATLATTADASAALDCELKKTPDGFVALRDKPTSSSSVLRKLDPKVHYVRLGGSGAVTSAWAAVTVFRHASPGINPIGKGWVSAALLDMCG